MKTAATAITPLTEANRNAVVQEEHVIDHCLVCYSSLVDYHVITPCGHAEICGVCHLRLRYLHADRKCPICKAESEQVIVDLTTAETTDFSDYNIWGKELGADFIYNEESQMFVRTEYYERELKPLFGYPCNYQNCSFDASTNHQQVSNNNNGENSNKSKKPIRILQDHLRNQHKLALCQLCVDHQRDFVSQLPRFTPSQLQKHLTQGDPASGFHGHPLCEFCRPKRFYDITALHHHLALEHFKCHVCEKQGISDQYFKNYSHLEKHFDRQHFLCRDVQCIMARFVVFANELDLKHHERTVHGASLGDTKIQLEFRVARSSSNVPQNQSLPNDAEFNYGVDGQAFVPAALPGNNDGGASNTVTLHPLHVQRTAQLREQAASLRTSHNQATRAEEFPTLQPNVAGASASMRTGWTSTAQRTRSRGPAGAVTQEDFPSLPAAAPAPRQKFNKLQAMRPQAKPAPIASWGVDVRPAPSSSNTSHFPSLSRPSVGASRKNPPPMSSLSDFPAPPISSSPYVGPSMTSVAASNVTIDDMKATMGSLGYKQLKQLTQNLVVHETVNPADYVQLTAALFDDTNTHQKFVTALLQSCPPHDAAKEALQRLRQVQPRGLPVNNRTNGNNQNNGSNNAWAKKSKQNKELRQLAFGK